VMRKQEVPEAWLDGFAEFTRLGYRLPGGERHEVAVFERVS
jgi:hypothetical protein